MTDLIERLQQVSSDLANDPATMHWMVATIDEAIAALEAPLPDDVETDDE